MRDIARRRALTLIELLVVLAILAVSLALLLVAVQQARLSAIRIDNANNMRQWLLATHSHCNSTSGQLPDVDGRTDGEIKSLMRQLAAHTDAGSSENPPVYARLRSDPSWQEWLTTRVGRPTVGPGGKPIDTTVYPGSSFAFNPHVYSKSNRFPHSISDGSGNTMAVTEHYSTCNGTLFDYILISRTCFNSSGVQIPCNDAGVHRTTFADYPKFADNHPISSAGVTTGRVPGTFQLRPALRDCDPSIPQATLPSGLLVGFLDGSVRVISPTVSDVAFWSAVTPAGGETVGID